MDATLRAILAELFGVSVEVDRLRQRVAELEQTVQQQREDFRHEQLPAGWRLVKD